MKKEDLTEEEETNSEKVLLIIDHPIQFNQLQITTSDDGNTMKKKNEREEVC